MNLLANRDTFIKQVTGEQWQLITAALLGLVLLLLVGFLPQQDLHNAAHDARHSVSFPCH